MDIPTQYIKLIIALVCWVTACEIFIREDDEDV